MGRFSWVGFKYALKIFFILFYLIYFLKFIFNYFLLSVVSSFCVFYSELPFAMLNLFHIITD